eukprot:2875543-Karenia_brevis.AAC.1
MKLMRRTFSMVMLCMMVAEATYGSEVVRALIGKPFQVIGLQYESPRCRKVGPTQTTVRGISDDLRDI